MQKTKMKLMKMSTVTSCSIGVLVGFVSLLLFSSVGALCIVNEYLEPDSSGVVAMLILFITILLASTIAGKITQSRQLLCCIVTASVYFLMQTGIAILLFDGISNRVFVGVIPAVLGIAASLIIVLNTKNRSVRRTFKKRHR